MFTSLPRCSQNTNSLIYVYSIQILSCFFKCLITVVITLLYSTATQKNFLYYSLYIISISKTASKKTGALICSMKFLSPEFALYLYKSIIQPCHVWAGACSCYLELLDELQKRICKTVGPSLAASLEPLAHHQNVASLSLFCRYYFRRCSSELAQLVPLAFSRGRSTHYSDRLHDFLSPFLDVTRMSMSSFFPCTTRLWNSLLIECFTLTYNLNGFTSIPCLSRCDICDFLQI